MGRVALVFDQIELNWTGSSTKTVQIPIPVSPKNVSTKFTIRIAGHVNGTKYVYERKQWSDTRVVRAQLGPVPVTISSAGGTYHTLSSLFGTEDVGGNEYTLGGAVGSASSLTFTPDDVTITGQVNLQSSGSITSSPVIGNGITSHAEVNTSGLDIHTN